MVPVMHKEAKRLLDTSTLLTTANRISWCPHPILLIEHKLVAIWQVCSSGIITQFLTPKEKSPFNSLPDHYFFRSGCWDCELIFISEHMLSGCVLQLILQRGVSDASRISRWRWKFDELAEFWSLTVLNYCFSGNERKSQIHINGILQQFPL